MATPVEDNGATAVMSLADLHKQAEPQAAKPLLLMVDNGQVFRMPLPKDENIVGRHTETDVKLDFADVSRRHCRIAKEGRGYVIEDLGSSGGTFLTSEGLSEGQVTKKTMLSDHDVIRIGAHRFHFIMASTPRPEDFPQLIPVSGGPMVQLGGAVSSIGRINADLSLNDPRVSTKHAIIETFGPGSVYVIDQNSANGTTVNDKKVVEPIRLQEHDVVGFAGIKYRVGYAGSEAKTMIGVVNATGSERDVVGSGTLRFDAERHRVMEAIADEKQDLRKTMFPMENTGVSKRPAPANKESRATTGTFTGPHPLAQQQETGPAWLLKLKRRLREPGGTMALRIGGGVLALALLLYPYVLTVSGECRLTPATVQKVRGPMQGRVEKVMVVEGQRVMKGDVLLRFSDRDLQYELHKAQQALADATKGKDARGKLLAEREVERVQAMLDLTVVRAGIDGKVVTPSPQDLTNVVVTAGQELLEIDDTRRVVAEVLVPESDIGEVAVGQKVYARVYTDTTESYESDVQTIMPVAEKSLLGSVVVVKAVIPNDDERLIPGTTGVAKIVGRRHMGVVLLLKKVARIFK